ncbi:uncharacterized protein EI90DRAFT_3126783 [Cantharellus anzutake]|uniref:uncharacterized protein n=1 Tax=Cantharellus anzutake TaxID=1750568 RepID=UPI001902C746|nr:uncharacterized protein EI90DRAFT_3126783 [Cantharellus anzutake]KAF8327761.1 hypothetical protein EI90DRAFT_3126783 [Cantharellus anzutake]
MPSHTPTAPRRGTVMTEDTFHAMADAENPPSLAVSDVYQALIDESAGLAPLRDAEVSEVFCYRRNGSRGREYYLMLNMRLLSSYSQARGASTVVWACAERVPSTEGRSIIDVIRRVYVAWDNIKFSYHIAAIRGLNDVDVPIVKLYCNNVKFIHAAHVFNITHDHSRHYHPTSFNRWWFAIVSIGALRHLDQNNDSIQFPNKNYIKAAAKAVRDTKEITKRVTLEFFSTWDVRSAADLGNEATWEPRRDHPPTAEFLPQRPRQHIPTRPALLFQPVLSTLPESTLDESTLTDSTLTDSALTDSARPDSTLPQITPGALSNTGTSLYPVSPLIQPVAQPQPALGSFETDSGNAHDAIELINDDAMFSPILAKPRRSFVMTGNTFHAMADSNQPPSLAVSDVHQALLDESAGLAFLRDAEVINVLCYHRDGTGAHDYLMLHIRLGQGAIVLARAERVPSTQERGIGMVPRGSAAWDNIKFSYYPSAIRGPGDIPIMILRCHNVKLVHCTQLFSIIHGHSQEYDAKSFNCWWFAAVSIGALRHLDHRNDWFKLPSKDWIYAAVRIVGSNMKEVTNNVTHEFLRKVVDLSNEATWEHSRDPPSGTEFLLRPPPQPDPLPHPISIPQPTLIPHHQPTLPSSLPPSSPSTEIHSNHGSVYPPPIIVSRDLGIDLVQDVVVTHDIEVYKVLVVGHKSAVSSGELLRVLETIWGGNRAQLKDGVLLFLHTWVLLGFLDGSFTSEVLRLVDEFSGSPPFSGRQEIWQIQNALTESALTRPSPPFPVRKRPLAINGSGSIIAPGASGKQKIKGKTIGEMDSNDLLGLAKALLEKEVDDLEHLTMPRAVKLLIDWRNDPEASDSILFSPLAKQIQDWVNEECLNKNHKVRQKAFQSFYLLACECEKLGDFASSHAIARTLCGKYLKKFELIQAHAVNLVGGSEGLQDALQRLSEPSRTTIPPIDYRLRQLLPLFHAIRDDVATVNWEACKLFYQSLVQELRRPVLPPPEANIDESYHEVLHERMYEAFLHRSNHQSLSEHLSAHEGREMEQMRAWEHNHDPTSGTEVLLRPFQPNFLPHPIPTPQPTLMPQPTLVLQPQLTPDFFETESGWNALDAIQPIKDDGVTSLTEHTFHAMANSTQPQSLAISDLHQALIDEPAELAFLRDAEVTDVVLYHRDGISQEQISGGPRLTDNITSMAAHDYLMLRMRLGSGSIVWARAERVPSMQERGTIQDIACDIITFSYHAHAIRGPEDGPVMTLRCSSLNFVLSTLLFSIIHRHSQEYHTTSLWFAAVSIGTLHHLDEGNDWIGFPSKVWIGAAARVINGSAKEVTKNVTHTFLSLCNIRKVVDLSNEATWGHCHDLSPRTEFLPQPPQPQPTLGSPETESRRNPDAIDSIENTDTGLLPLPFFETESRWDVQDAEPIGDDESINTDQPFLKRTSTTFSVFTNFSTISDFSTFTQGSVLSTRSAGEIFLLKDLCEKVIEKHLSLQSARIVSTSCYSQYRAILLHRFLILELRRPGKRDVWLRIERRAGLGPLSLARQLGKSRARDTAQLSASKEVLAGAAQEENIQEFKRPPSLAEFGDYLRIICEELLEYTIWQENCWMFCSLLQEHLGGSGSGHYTSGCPVAPNMASTVRDRISERVAAHVSSNAV